MIPRSAVIGFPNAATGCSHKQCDLARWLVHSRDAGDASAHCRRADVARAEPGNAGRIKWRVSRVNRNGANKKRCENASHSNGRDAALRRPDGAARRPYPPSIKKRANSVLRKLWQCTTALMSLLVIHCPHRVISAVVGGHLFGRGNEISCHPRARWLRVYR